LKDRRPFSGSYDVREVDEVRDDLARSREEVAILLRGYVTR